MSTQVVLKIYKLTKRREVLELITCVLSIIKVISWEHFSIIKLGKNQLKNFYFPMEKSNFLFVADSFYATFGYNGFAHFDLFFYSSDSVYLIIIRDLSN